MPASHSITWYIFSYKMGKLVYESHRSFEIISTGKKWNLSKTKILIIVVMTMLVNLVNSRVCGVGYKDILTLWGGNIYKNFHLLSN